MSESKEEVELEVDDVDQFGHPKIPYRGYHDREHCDSRIKWAEKFGNCSLKQCGQWWLNEGTHDSYSCQKLKGNIENSIGLAKVPLGLCGPLLIRGDHVQGYCLCPVATSEGAVVASITRGATALTQSGGVHVRVLEQTQIRSPYFVLRNSVEVDIFLKWIAKNFEVLQQRIRKVSQHAQLRKIESTHFGRAVVVHFYYNTGNACGQNMVTSCTTYLCKWIQSVVETELPQVKIAYYFITTGLSGDKRIAFINHLRTRGCRVQAEAWIPKSVMKSVLKVDISMFLACYEAFKTSMCAAGAMGFTINVSNLVTGVCIATGQDAASVESSIAQLTISPLTAAEWMDLGKEMDENLDGDVGYAGVYVNIVLPSLNVGTVGGGTYLATQRECLNLIGCNEKNGTGRLCEVIAGYALGLEISTLSAIASGQFASAHEKLGRNHPELGFRKKDFNATFFSSVLGVDCTLIDATPFDVDAGNSILSDITLNEVHKKVGRFGYTIKYSANGHAGSIAAVIKSKTTGLETCNMLNKIAQTCTPNLATQYEIYKMQIGFTHTDIREIEIYRIPELQRFFPRIYYTQMLPHKEVFVIAMEYLSDEKVTHLNTVDDISVWTTSDIKVVLRDLAALHATHFNKTAKLETYEWMETVRGKDLVQLWTELLKEAHFKFPRVWTSKRFIYTDQAIKSIGHIESVLMAAPITLIHNDCNPRHLCLRRPDVIGDGGILSTITDNCRLCLFDWELAQIGSPQRDLIEFLAFTLKPSTPIETWLELVHFYRGCLEEYTGLLYPPERFIKVFNCAAWDFTVKRLLMYTMVCTIKDYSFLPRVVDSTFTYLEHAVNSSVTINNSKL